MFLVFLFTIFIVVVKFKLYIFTICISFLSFYSCKKTEKTPSEAPSDTHNYWPSTYNPNASNSWCKLVTSVSSDTNFIPHKKNNTWSYCSSYGNVADRNGTVIKDTFYQNKYYFEILFNFPTSHPSGPTGWLDKYVIDSLGRYYYSSSLNNYIDTILLIDPHAINGDTIYNNISSNVKVVLINKADTVSSFLDCYHIRIIRPNYSYPDNHYYKKGLGDLFYMGTLWLKTIN